MKKKLIIVLATAMMTMSLAACSSGNEADKQPQTQTENTQTENTQTENTQTENTQTENTQTENTQTENTQTETENTQPETEQVQVADSAAVLNNVWTTYGEDEKFFAMGGDMNHPVDNAAGIYSLDDTEALGASLLVPNDAVAMIDEAASLIHGMNANTFTGAAFHLTDAGNVDAFADAMKNNILNTQWMCGFPDQLAIYKVNDEYVISAFGNAEIMETFKNKVSQVFGESAKLLVDEQITQ